MSQQAGGEGPAEPEEGAGPPPLEHLAPWDYPEYEELEDEEGDDFLDEGDEMDMDEAWEDDDVCKQLQLLQYCALLPLLT